MNYCDFCICFARAGLIAQMTMTLLELRGRVQTAENLYIGAAIRLLTFARSVKKKCDVPDINVWRMGA